MAKSNWFQDFIVSTISGTISTVGESKLVEVLQTLHDTNIVTYNAVVEGAIALLDGLAPLVEASSNTIDDAFLKALRDAIDTSIDNNAVKEEE